MPPGRSRTHDAPDPRPFTVRNTNGLLRQYFPKGTDFDTVTDQRLREAADELNDRPRLVLADRTPAQLMRRWLRQPIRNVP